MLGRDIVVIGASAGGVDTLTTIVSGLPAGLNASVFIVLHVGASPNRLAEILGRRSRVPVSSATDGEPIAPTHVYIAPPDVHMTLQGGCIHLVRGPKENFTRPAIDPLFRSAAAEYGARVIGIVLTGYLDDGSAGLIAIKDRGGIAIVQDPDEAFAPSMPQSAIACVAVDHLCGAADIAPLVERYDPPDPNPLRIPVGMPAGDASMAADNLVTTQQELDRLGAPSPFTCPDCGGVLYQLHDDRLVRFRCRTGHAMSARALLWRLPDVCDRAIASAVRSLTEEAALLSRLVPGAADRQLPPAAAAAILLAQRLHTTLRVGKDQPEAAPPLPLHP